MAGALTETNAPSVPGSPPSLVRWDRSVKWTLFISSLITLTLLLAAMFHENFMSPWRHVQNEYRQMLLSSSDEKQRKLGEKFDTEIRQVDLPQLGTVDRCVSCHNGLENPAFADARQPHRMHSGKYLQWHPVSKYGCTICHRGQGSATDFFEAKAVDVHWDYPLLPLNLTQASCGSCHATDSKEMQTHAPLLAEGRQLFVDRGCQSCHKINGVGGQLGPALDTIGMRIKHQLPMANVAGEHTLPNWLAQHFDNPQKIVAGSQMRPPKLTVSENVALTVYMLSLSNRDLPQTYVPKDRIAAQNREHFHKEMDGAVLFKNYCANCHGNGSFAEWDKFFVRFMPAVRGPGLRGLADHDYFKTAITQGRPGTLMPAWGKNAGGLTDEQVEKLVTYLMAGDQRKWTPPASPLASVSGGNAQRGNELFQQMCAGCHGANKLAPTLSNTVLLQSASDDFLARTILFGRPDTPMPAFRREGAQGLSDEEVRDLIAYVRSMGKKGSKP
jgi:mono/diheme cytochrome c family protein